MQQTLSTDVFKQQYERLNSAQQKAVDTLEGPVMVLAGPGTGKTQVLASRVANILLKTDERPENILALTFTESAAKNMRQRLVGMIGKAAYYVQIETFHSFCAGVIAGNPDYFALPRESEPLADLERFELLQALLDEVDLEVLKPRRAPYFYLKDIQKSLSDLKREGISVSDFESIVAEEAVLLENEREELKKTEVLQREKNLAKQRELVRVYQEYQERLVAASRFDYDDMIALVVRAFQEHEMLLLEYQEKIHYFLVDEYQDTNSAQNAIVDLLAQFWEDRANVFVVGDPNQAIYRFQGASLENVLGFVDRYPSATVIGLTTGYRATQQIYAAAADLIAENDAVSTVRASAEGVRMLEEYAKASRLESVHTGTLPLAVYAAPSHTLETVFVAEKIAALLAKGVAPEEIAVLYRNNAQSAVIGQTLEKWEIPFEAEGTGNALDAECIEQLLTLYQAIDNLRQGAENGELFRVLQYEWLGVPPLLVMQASRAAHRGKQSIADLVAGGFEAFGKLHTGSAVTPLEFSLLETAVNKLLEWGTLDTRIVFTEWFETVLNESGFMSWILSRPQKTHELNLINSLFREVRGLVQRNHNLRLSQFLEIIATMRTHNLSITVEDITCSDHAVKLSTVHKAKGQEWRYVFVMGLVDGVWGNTRKREMIPLPQGILRNTDFSKKERNEDDRRLLYVALTRAKDQVFLSYSETMLTDNRSKEMMGSLFLTEITSHLQPIDVQFAEQITSNTDKHLARLLGPSTARQVSPSETEYFTHLVSDFKLSVSALNTYLRDSQAFMLQHLLKVPSATSVALGFGTAMHAALEQMYKPRDSESALLPLEQVQAVFARSLERELLLEGDLERELAHGRTILEQYYAQVLQSYTTAPVYIERFFGSGWSKPMLGDIPLTGRIDRVDWIDRAKKTVRVIDYKTGSVRTASEIDATSKTAFGKLSPREQALPEGVRGPYKRQLLFYKLLTDLDRTFEPVVVAGVFDFVEPDKRTGSLVQRQVAYEPEELEQLQALIREVMAEIRGLAFLKSTKLQ